MKTGNPIQKKFRTFTILKTVPFLIVTLVLLNACKKDPDIDTNSKIDEGNRVISLTVPKGLPYPIIPEDNLPTKNRIALGKRLFFDPILSRDSTIACGSCHFEDKYFVDNLKVSVGIQKRTGQRNAPTVLNTAYHPYFFWDGGNPTLEQQVLGPIGNPLEMDYNVVKVVERLIKHKDYPALFKQAYGQTPSVFTLTRAIANYERTLLSGNSRYDEYLHDNDTTVLTASEKRGMNIFFGEKGECFHCHGGFNFTDNSFQNNGIYLTYADSGRARVTQLTKDIGKFKVPSLRNIDKTAPYMHDGSMASLEEVVEHYNSGGTNHRNKSPFVLPLNLSTTQKQDLVNFLKALTSEN